MATYKYQQTLYDGASEGYVKYNISPALGTRLSAGETITITGQIYRRDMAIYGVLAELHVGVFGDTDYRTATIGKKSVKVSKGKTGTFTINATLKEDDLANLGELTGRVFDALITFTLADDAAMTGGAETETVAAQKIALLKYREAPTITEATLTDATDAAAVFGGLVQGQSVIRLNMRAETDPLDGAVTIKSRELRIGTTVHAITADVQDVGVIDESGIISWTLRVTDSKGLYSETTRTIELLSYQLPTIDMLTAQRYREVIADDGSVDYIAADDGEHVWFNLVGTVFPLAERNTWRLTAAWDGREREVMTGADGTLIVLNEDREAVTELIPAASRMEFAWTLTDYFGSATLRAAVEKAGAYFDVEKNGVSVGMRSQGTPEDKRFEVAEDYKAHFYGGIISADGYRMDACGRWEYLDITNGNFAAYNTAYAPRISRVGPLVFLDGMAKNTAALDASFIETIATLPEWARPVTDVHALQQGSGRALWWLRVAGDGGVTARRYRDESGYTDAPETSQFPLSLSWIAADAYITAQEEGD